MPWVWFENETQVRHFLTCSHKEYEYSGNGILLTKEEAPQVSQHIRAFYEKPLLKSILKKRFFGFSPDETGWILESCCEHADKDLRIFDTLSDEVLQLLENKRQLFVCGAKDFSLLNYKKLLGEIVEQGIEGYIAEREKAGFIALLRYYVGLQSTIYRIVHVFHNGNEYQVLNEQYDLIQIYDDSKSSSSLISDISSEEDWLLGILITIAPKRIILHNITEKVPNAFLKTMKSVFEERIVICDGCHICKIRT